MVKYINFVSIPFVKKKKKEKNLGMFYYVSIKIVIFFLIETMPFQI